MARKSKEVQSLYNLKNDNKKRNVKNKKSVNKQSEVFSFDEEMIIGVNKKEERINKEEKNIKNVKKRKKNKKKQPKKQVKLTQEQLQKMQEKRKRTIKIIKWVSITLLFIVLVVITMFSPIFNIKNITVIGNEKITENEIISLSQIQLEENIYKIIKSKVKKNIKENSYIENVTIKRKLPSQIQINIEERKPTFMVEYGASYIYIDKQGYILEISEEPINLPILQGIQTESEKFNAGARLNNEDLEKLNTVLKIVELAKNNDILELINRIDIENNKDYKLILETKGKTVYIGDETNLSTKLLNVKAIIEKTEGISGDILVNMDLNSEYPIFRERV